MKVFLVPQFYLGRTESTRGKVQLVLCPASMKAFPNGVWEREKRNIETWFHYLDEHDCFESKSYKSLHKNSRPSKFAKKLHEEICFQRLPDDAPPSLFHACQELKRLQID